MIIFCCLFLNKENIIDSLKYLSIIRPRLLSNFLGLTYLSSLDPEAKAE